MNPALRMPGKAGARKAAVIGWDIGGAHLKAVALDEHGAVLDARELPTPLWRGLDSLERAIDAVLAAFGDAGRHALTMTAELADCFESRAQGVTEIVGIATSRLHPGSVDVYAGPAGFVAPNACADAAMNVASANWHATATHASSRIERGLLLDIGSTTADVVGFDGGRLVPAACTDAERLAAGSLVYTGATRTPVYAVADRAPVRGVWVPLAAELFATMADVYRLTRELPAEADLLDTADGRDKSVAASAARLARMAGTDAGGDTAPWERLAEFLARRQRAHVADAMAQVISAHPSPEGLTVIGAGAGRFIAERIAAEQGLVSTQYATLFAGAPDHLAALEICAPAAAVAALALAARP